MTFYTTDKIFIYPVKSLGAVHLDALDISSYGLKDDRRWMIVDKLGRMVSQRDFPTLNLIKCTKVENGYQLHVDKHDSCIIFEEQAEGPETAVEIWSTKMIAYKTQTLASEWLSHFLKADLCIVSSKPRSRIKVNSFLPHGHELKFQDGYPIHLINSKSVEQIANWSNEAVHPMQFRPNIIINMNQAFEEDQLDTFSVNDIKFKNIKSCERCIMTTIKPNTSSITKEPLATLSKHRNINNHVVFGIYIMADH